MRELTQYETEAVNGAGVIADIFKDIEYAVRRMPVLYDAAITSTADMMCRATGKC